jgi:cytochrome c biogenesis protein CcdA
MINEWLDTLSLLITENVWLAPLLALLAGILTSITPCSLSAIPLVIAYVGGTSDSTKKSFKLSLAFALGSSITFTILGVAASLLGNLMGGAGKWWYILLGILMVLMAFQIFEIYEFIPSTYLMSKSTKKGYIGAVIAGILGGLFSSPCATPVLIVLLALVAGNGSIIWGTVLLLMYSIGHSALVIIAGTSMGAVRKLIQSEKYGRFSSVSKYIIGVLIALIGIYMFYLGF